ILQQLLRHGAKTGGGDKGLPHAAHARRHGSALLVGSDSACAGGSGGLFLGRRVLGRRALRMRALNWCGWLGLGDCRLQETEPGQGEKSGENRDCKTAHSNPTYCRKLAPMMERSSSARLRTISF